MALNPELYAASGGPLLPRLYVGECIFASRPSCKLSTSFATSVASAGVWFGRSPSSPWEFSGAGTVHLSNYRLVFIASKPTPEFQSIELPLLYIENFDVVQPIFGANYLHGQCRTSGGTPGLTWRLAFTSGGMSTIVPLFYQTVAYVRSVAGSQREQRTEEVPTKAKNLPRDVLPDFVNAAVVDPSDPCVVYVVSEMHSEDDGARPEADFDTLWEKKTQ